VLPTNVFFVLIFQGEDPSIGNPNFWDELFLLKPKIPQLDQEISKVSFEQWPLLQENVQLIVSQSITILGHEHSLRNLYALQVSLGLHPK